MTNNNKTAKTTIIIGAGASGLFLANLLKNSGQKIILLEKKPQAGLKLRLTGKGRCNLTNACDKNTFLSHISNKEFFAPIFEQFDNISLQKFFLNLGLQLKTERGNRVYPLSDKSLDVFLSLIKPIENSDIVFEKNCEVYDLIIENQVAVGVKSSLGEIRADNIIISTGGKTYPSTGSTGQGYKILSKHSIKIVDPIPGLVGLRTKEAYTKDLQDTIIKNCQLNIFDDNDKIIFSLFGELYLDEYGISGPIVLNASRQIARLLDSGHKLYANIDYKPKIDKATLYKEILDTIQERRSEAAFSVIRKWLTRDLTEHLLLTTCINPRVMARRLKEQDAKSILWYLKTRKDLIVGDMGWNEAIITLGGVALNEIDPLNMQTKKIKNLFVTGELLDLDADTGGYNLQIAFSTAYQVARYILQNN